MHNQMILCIPGTWESRAEFLKAVVTSTSGEYLFAGLILAHPNSKDHVQLEFCERDDRMARAFRLGGQGKLSDETLSRIAQHNSVVYLNFPFDIVSQRLRLVKFTEVIAQCGGIAVKLETSGVAHEWARWFSLLRSDNLFDLYCACVILISSEEHYYSCGMHNFGLPDSQIPKSFDIQEAADLLNQFNYYQIAERPRLESGHTFSLTADSPRFRVRLLADQHHTEDDLFYNPHGIWYLTHI